MHEQWKKRKMFSNREQGIMSGLDPVPMMAGGSVPYPGMEMGGIVSHTHPELHSHGPSKIDPGFIRELAPKMQVGGVVPQPQLFEEGDAEVNDALNMMASVAKPDVPDMPMPMMDEKVEVREEVTEDQGPDGYKEEVQFLKDNFKEQIRSYVSGGEATDNIESYLKDMGKLYRSKLSELKEKYRVTEYLPDEELISEEFLAEIIPGMTTGNVVYTPQQIAEAQEVLDSLGINLTPQQFLGMPKDQQEEFKNIFLVQKAQMVGTPVEATPDNTNLMNLLKERRGLAKQAGSVASSAFATTGSDAGELLGKINAGKAAELGAMDTALADEIAVAKALLTAQARSSGSGTNMPKLTEYQRNLLSGRDDNVSGLDDKFYEKAYTDLLKPDPYSGALPSALDALSTFVSLYRQVPPSRSPEFQGKKDINGIAVSFDNFVSNLYQAKPELTRDELKEEILNWLKAQPAT